MALAVRDAAVADFAVRGRRLASGPAFASVNDGGAALVPLRLERIAEPSAEIDR
jgi:hypothetical protein